VSATARWGTTHLMLCYDHGACDTYTDVYLRPPDARAAEIEEIGKKHRPVCPACQEPMKFVAWCFKDPAS
jgi:hypothetical protein